MAIDEEKIIAEVSKLPLIGDDNGIISAFGVYLTRMFGDYYAEISYEFEREFQKDAPPEIQDIAKQLLIEAGHVCGFNTFGGIMKSDEWKAMIVPMIEKREDWIRGMVAVINTLGWGKYRIHDIKPDELLILDIENSYESTYYLQTYNERAQESKCYLAVGASVALFNLVYYGDITTEPELDEDFYNQLFKFDNKFLGEEIMCRSRGDNICRIQVKLRS